MNELASPTRSEPHGPVTPNLFSGSDSDRIEAAIAAAGSKDRRVVIPADNSNGSGVWLIDRAILIPGDFTLVLDGCTIQLADDCIDNIIRSANVGDGGSAAPWVHNVRIVGVGDATLRGASKPRSTGEGKQLALDSVFESPLGRGRCSYGSDAGLPGVAQLGDWRNHGIVMAYVDGFELTNVTLENTHCWAVSHERVRHAYLAGIRIKNPPHVVIDGATRYVANRDGINLRQGCQHFVIDSISGETGDDFIALTLLPKFDDEQPAVALSRCTATNPGYEGRSDDIVDVSITNITCKTKNHGVALRTIGDASIRDVTINGLTVSGNEEIDSHQSAMLFGGRGYGPPSPLGCIRNVQAMNLVSSCRSALIHVEAAISDCDFVNGVYTGDGEHVVSYHDFDDTAPKYTTSPGNRGRSNVANVREINLFKSGVRHGTEPTGTG